MATGSGTTLVAARSAQELQAGRVLVLVPSLELLAQIEAAWRARPAAPALGSASPRWRRERGLPQHHQGVGADCLGATVRQGHHLRDLGIPRTRHPGQAYRLF
ncbi:DEAD/DEAH box helicase family protein [Streptomyces sp. NPDC055793]